jgi:hypothetical protein
MSRKLPWTFRCQAYPDWSKTTSTLSSSQDKTVYLGKTTALAQKKSPHDWSSIEMLRWRMQLDVLARQKGVE